ncbi:MAG: hypothetical protein K0R76_1458 [Alphaproteobacteria bacterium]|nr:hypothetical protein [Alphaproteobacteria bacterium]
MKKIIYFIFGFVLVNFCASITQAVIIKEVNDQEVARGIAPLYRAYHQREDIAEEQFVSRWQETSGKPGYYMIAAYREAADQEPLGFMDFAIFPSLYASPSMMRIDSVFINTKVPEEEESIYRALYERAVDIGKESNVKKIICDSRDDYLQELRLFPLTMQPQERNVLFAAHFE